jgi:MFS family permease
MGKAVQLFPLARIKNVRLFYLLTVFTNGWFINSNWIFLALTLMTKTQLGLVDGGSFLIGTLVDLPSGALADLVGRRKTIIFSRMLFALASFIFIFSFNVWVFALANTLFFIGVSFYAGADQALLFDSLQVEHEEASYLKIITRTDLLSKTTTFIASIVGGIAFAFNIRYPFVLLFIFAVIALICAFQVEEVNIENKRRVFNLRNFLHQQADGIRILMGTRLRHYFPLFFVILGTSIIFGWGILKGFIAMMYGFDGSMQTFIFGTLSFATGLLGLLLPKIVSRSSDFRVALGLSLFFCIGFLLTGYFTSQWIWGLLVLLIINISGGTLNILSQKIVNDEVESHLRATALSALSIITKIPYVFAAFIIGLLAQANQLTIVTRIITLTGLSALVAAVVIKKMTKRK